MKRNKTEQKRNRGFKHYNQTKGKIITWNKEKPFILLKLTTHNDNKNNITLCVLNNLSLKYTK